MAEKETQDKRKETVRGHPQIYQVRQNMEVYSDPISGFFGYKPGSLANRASFAKLWPGMSPSEGVHEAG
jgi:hypothetical protein